MYTKRSYLIHAALLMAVVSLAACSKTEAAPTAAATVPATAASSSAQMAVGMTITDPAAAPAPMPEDSYNLKATLETAGKVHGDEAIDYDSYAYPVENGNKTADGYPVFLIECDIHKEVCTDTSGQVIGTLRMVAENLTPVRNSDVMRADWACREGLCLDASGAVVGAIQPDMETWLAANPTARRR